MKNIKIEIKNKICIVYIDRIKSFNAINSEVIRELADTFTKYRNSKEFRSLILTGVGDQAFIAGADIKAMSKIQGQATSCANSIGQMAGIEALTGDQNCVDEMRSKFRERRDYIIPLLNSLPEVTCAVPGGAFYVFPDFSSYLGRKANDKILKDTFDISEYILGSARVVTVPGDGFGAPGHIRFSYATSKVIIQKGIERVKTALEKII